MVLIGISEERVVRKGIVEILIEIEQVHYVHLDRIDLIIESVLNIAHISVGCGYNVSCVFRTVLVIIRNIYICPWHRLLEISVWQREEFRKAQSCGHSEFV